MPDDLQISNLIENENKRQIRSQTRISSEMAYFLPAVVCVPTRQCILFCR